MLGLFGGITDPLSVENPPPCNKYYLMSCLKGASTVSLNHSLTAVSILRDQMQPGVCKYSHDYTLTWEQMVSLA